VRGDIATSPYAIGLLDREQLSPCRSARGLVWAHADHVADCTCEATACQCSFGRLRKVGGYGDGGREHDLRQTLIALTAGTVLGEHEAPGEATLQVMKGQVVLRSGRDHWEGGVGDHVVIPQERHDLAAIADSVVLLTVATRPGAS